jgi:hypothetical protein
VRQTQGRRLADLSTGWVGGNRDERATRAAASEFGILEKDGDFSTYRKPLPARWGSTQYSDKQSVIFGADEISRVRTDAEKTFSVKEFACPSPIDFWSFSTSDDFVVAVFRSSESQRELRSHESSQVADRAHSSPETGSFPVSDPSDI